MLSVALFRKKDQGSAGASPHRDADVVGNVPIEEASAR
jgi:hypothetical protein